MPTTYSSMLPAKQVNILFKTDLSVRVRQYRRSVCLPVRMSTPQGILDVIVRH
jgi:hypothetical protein